MTWEQIRERLQKEVEKGALSPDSFGGLNATHGPNDIADCCGIPFGAHVTWEGRWLPCKRDMRAAWTRKKNREAKLRKKAKRIAEAAPGAGACECEHAAHFPDEKKPTPNGKAGHLYGETRPDIRKVLTYYGTYAVCNDCLDDCHAGLGKEVA